MSTAVIYHADCPDGWTAAWVAHKAIVGPDHCRLDLIPARYGEPAPDVEPYSRVYIVDFSYPFEVLTELGRNRHVVVLDHHQTAMDDISAGLRVDPDDKTTPGGYTGASLTHLSTIEDGVPRVDVWLDTTRSGAGITWDYFHPNNPRPALVDYVEDRDLWRHRLPGAGPIGAWIRTHEYTLAAWDEMDRNLSHGEGGRGHAVTQGSGALAHIEAYCRAAAKHAYWCTMGDRTFPIVNVTYESCSEVAAYLLDVFEVDMAGYFFQRGDGRWQYGFRSRNGATVNDHAEQFGGGGHPQASGCTTDEISHRRRVFDEDAG